MLLQFIGSLPYVCAWQPVKTSSSYPSILLVHLNLAKMNVFPFILFCYGFLRCLFIFCLFGNCEMFSFPLRQKKALFNDSRVLYCSNIIYSKAFLDGLIRFMFGLVTFLPKIKRLVRSKYKSFLVVHFNEVFKILLLAISLLLCCEKIHLKKLYWIKGT